jgi:hypothetical protein
MRAMSLRLLPVVLLLSIGGTLAACGDDEDPFRENPNSVFERAMQAVHDADWGALVPLLTKRARFALERDLRRLRARLAHPQDGKREREIAEARLGPDAEREIQLAADGDFAAVLRFFVRISPRPALPKAPQRKLGAFECEILYVDGDGNLRPVRLVRQRDGWYVDELQL